MTTSLTTMNNTAIIKPSVSISAVLLAIIFFVILLLTFPTKTTEHKQIYEQAVSTQQWTNDTTTWVKWVVNN